jgi:hypothetical protein
MHSLRAVFLHHQLAIDRICRGHVAVYVNRVNHCSMVQDAAEIALYVTNVQKTM